MEIVNAPTFGVPCPKYYTH